MNTCTSGHKKINYVLANVYVYNSRELSIVTSNFNLAAQKIIILSKKIVATQLFMKMFKLYHQNSVTTMYTNSLQLIKFEFVV